MRDALKNYIALASGLTEVTKQQAKSAAKALVKQGEAKREQVTEIAEELLATSRSNRAAINAVVRSEVERALGRVGVVTNQELSRVSRRLQQLESTLRGGRGEGKAAARPAKPAAAAAKPAAPKAAPKPAKASKPAKPAPAKPTKPVAKKTTAKKATATKAAATKGTRRASATAAAKPAAPIEPTP